MSLLLKFEELDWKQALKTELSLIQFYKPPKVCILFGLRLIHCIPRFPGTERLGPDKTTLSTSPIYEPNPYSDIRLNRV